jgi:hypothetical protein
MPARTKPIPPEFERAFDWAETEPVARRPAGRLRPRTKGAASLAPAPLDERVSLWPHAHLDDSAIVTLPLDWDKATLHPIDDRTQRLDVPLPDELAEHDRRSLSSALVGLEEIGGPIENAKLSRSHVRMEITLDADLQAIRQRVEALAGEVLRPTGEASN